MTNVFNLIKMMVVHGGRKHRYCKNLLLDGINAFNLIPLIEMLERIKHGY